MNILQENINNSHWLDLYSGSGVIGCEAIERGAKKIVAVEANPKTYKTCHLNLTNIAKANKKEILIEVMNTEAIKFLKAGFQKYSLKSSNKQNAPRFDYIYLDPPYKSNCYCSALEFLLSGNWVSCNCLAICEFSIEEGIEVPPQWIVKSQKTYGRTGLIFLTPNQA